MDECLVATWDHESVPAWGTVMLLCKLRLLLRQLVCRWPVSAALFTRRDVLGKTACFVVMLCIRKTVLHALWGLMQTQTADLGARRMKEGAQKHERQ